MDPRDFLDVAGEWSVASREAEWRSAVSRAYYAAYHVGREVLGRGGFAVPAGPQGHGYVWLRLANSDNRAVVEAGNTLNALRSLRNRADYDLAHRLDDVFAVTQVGVALEIVRVLDELAENEAILADAVTAIREYERNVLGEETWRAPGQQG